jgi:hypothetical protein
MNNRATSVNDSRPGPPIHDRGELRAEHAGFEIVRTAADRVETSILPDRRE